MAVLIAGATFSFCHLASDLLACGRDLAGWEARWWLAAAAVQGVLFMLGARSERARRAYATSQYLVMPLVFVALAQLVLAHSRVFVWISLFGGTYWLAVALPAVLRGRAPSFARGPGAFVGETTLFLLALLVVHSAIAFLFLHRPDARLDDRAFWIIAAGSGLLCAWLVRREVPREPLSVGEFPPLALLAIVLLRAKLPDGSFDALLYKSTVPILVADWRTAVTGVLDHTMVATNLGEIMAAQLRILDPAYPPALGSSLAFLALWSIAPMAARGLFGEGYGPGRDFGRRAVTLVAVSITEPLLAAGTSYQEPLLSLLMVAFLLPLSAGWFFLAAAVATKLTVLLVAPALVALRFSSGVRLARPSLVLVSCLVLATLVAGEQLTRNLAFTGRVFGGSYILEGLTDPHNEVLASKPAVQAGTVPAPPSFTERVGKTLVHVLTLDLWLPVTEWDFHVLPSSRFIPVAMALGLCALLLPALRRVRARLVPLALWVACALATLAIVEQGRHLAPLSLAAALVVAHALANWYGDDGSRPLRSAWFAAALALAAFGDQVVGTFINVGWECRRSLLARVAADSPDHPQTDLEKRLAEIVKHHRAKAPPGGLPPSVVCEDPTEPKRYLGTHHIYTYQSTDLLWRYVAADPRRAARVPTSVLAVCFTTPTFAERILAGGARAFYDEVPGVGSVRIMVSRPLRDGARATSLYAPEGDRSPHGDLLARWEGGLLDEARADTPTGRGSFVTEVEGARVAALLSPHRIAFDAPLPGNGTLVLELAMPFPESDGMAIEVSLEEASGRRHSATLELAPRRGAAGLAWETRRIEVPPGFAGRGRLTFTASSPSGDMRADWVYLRKAAIEPPR